MGWGNCGKDSKGRPIGYAHEGTCDHDGCEVEIDRGLAFACGGMHGDDECGCEGYFCSDHMVYIEPPEEHCRGPVCQECEKIFKEAAKEETIEQANNINSKWRGECNCKNRMSLWLDETDVPESSLWYWCPDCGTCRALDEGYLCKDLPDYLANPTPPAGQ